MANPTATTDVIHHLMLVAVLAAALTTSAAQSPAPAPGHPISPAAPGPYPYATAPSPALDCFTYLVNLSDCLTFVEGGSNLTRPDPNCCPELANLVDTQPICLCQLLGNPGQVGFSVDVSRALKLPSVCNVTTPPVSLCAVAGVPVGALTPSESETHGIGVPVAGGVLAPGNAPSQGGGGSAAASPSPGDGENGSPANLGCCCSFQFLLGLSALLITFLF